MPKQRYVIMTGGSESVGSRVANPIVYEDVSKRPRTELIAPVLSFGLVSGNPLIMEYSEELDADFVPATTDWDVQKNSGSAAVSSVEVVGTTVKLTMTVAIVQGDTLTVAYTRPTANTRLRDLRGNEVASFTAQTVLNYTPEAADTQVPRLSRIYGSDTSIVLDYDEQLTENSPTLTAFAVVVNGSGATESGVVVSGSVVTITIATGLVPGDTFTVAYTGGAVKIQDLAGNLAADFGATAGSNLSLDTQAPRLSYITGNGTSIKLHYDEPLTENTPTLSAFAVVVGGVGATESAVSVLGHVVDITISVALVSTDTFTVAYTAGATAILDRAGNSAANFGATAGENTTDVTVGGTPNTADYDDTPTVGTGPPPAGGHGHGMPSASASYDAIISASHTVAYWDDFAGRNTTVSSSERYSTVVSGGTTPAFGYNAVTGFSELLVGTNVNSAGEYTGIFFVNLKTRAADDWGFKCILKESAAPTIGAGDIFYLVGFLENGGLSNDDGIYFRSQDSGNWFLVCRNAGAETTRDMGVGPDTATDRLLEFRITGDGASVQAYVSNVATGAAITTNIPANLLLCGALVICDSTITTQGEVALRGWGVRDGY